MLFCHTFRARSSGPLLVDFHRLPLPSPEPLSSIFTRFSSIFCQAHNPGRKRYTINSETFPTCSQHVANPLPLTAFKNAPNPKFVQNLSRRLFFGVPIRGTQICQKVVENLKNDNFRTNFQNFDKFLTNLRPPDWNPEKQSLGQILDKFGVRGVFECCKGKEGSQPTCKFTFTTSPEFHACISYMGRHCSHAGVNDAHV